MIERMKLCRALSLLINQTHLCTHTHARTHTSIILLPNSDKGQHVTVTKRLFDIYRGYDYTLRMERLSVNFVLFVQ